MNPLTWEAPLVLTWAALFGIVLVRAGSTYLLGWLARAGAGRFPRIQRVFTSHRYRRAETLVGRWGAPLVAASFLTVGFQTMANLAAGAARMPLARYLPALAIGGACWALIFATIGIAGFAAVGAAYARWPVATLCIGAAVVLALLLIVLVRHRARPPED